MHIRALIPYEFRKYFTRFHIMLLVFLFLLNLALTVFSYREYFSEDYRKFQAKKDELITLYHENPEEYKIIAAEHAERVSEYNTAIITTDNLKSMPLFENHYIDLENYDDITLFSAVNGAVQSPSAYKTKMSSALRDALFRLKESDEGVYINQYYLEFCKQYMAISELELESEEVKGWNDYFSWQLPAVILAVALLGTLCTVFTDDIQAGMGNILHVSKHGGRAVVSAKLVFISVMSGILSLIFTAAPLVVFAFSSGLSSLSHPVQMINALEYCPFELTVGQYLILYLLLRMAVFTAFSLLAAVVNQIFNNEKFAFVTMAVIAGTGVFLAKINVSSNYYFLQKFSVTQLAEINILFEKYRGLNIFGHCVDYTKFMLAAVVIVIILLVVLSLTAKSDGLQEYSGRRIYIGKTSQSMSLIGTEAFKQLVCSKYFALLLAAVIIKCIVSGFYYHPSENYSESQYRDYIMQIYGEITDEKLQRIEAEDTYIKTSISEYERALSAYRSGNIEESEYNEYKKRSNYAEYYKYACERLCRRRDYLLNVSKVQPDVEFIYDAGLERYFSSSVDIVAVFLIVFMATNLFACEYEPGFYRIMRTTQKGRGAVFKTKLCYSLLTAVILYLLFSIIDAGFVSYYYDIDYWTVPVQSMPLFENVTSDMTVVEYMVLHKLVSMAGYIVSFLLALAFSAIMKSQIKAIITTLFIMLIPYVLVQMSIIPISVINYAEMIFPVNIENNAVSYITCAVLSLVCVGTAYVKWRGREYRK